MSWLPADFVAPTRVELRGHHHLRPIHPDDTDLDMAAVLGPQQRLGSIYGEAWGWPPADLAAEDDRADLARHAEEMTRNESFNSAFFDRGATPSRGASTSTRPSGPAPMRRSRGGSSTR